MEKYLFRILQRAAILIIIHPQCEQQKHLKYF